MAFIKCSEKNFSLNGPQKRPKLMLKNCIKHKISRLTEANSIAAVAHISSSLV